MQTQTQKQLNTIDDGFRHVHKEIDKSKKTITHYISSSDSNRYGQVLPVNGFDETEYRKNPLVYFNHGADDVLGTLTAQQKLEFLIGKNLWTKVDKENYLMVKTEFRSDKSNDFAMDVFDLNVSGDLNSWSKYWYPISEPYMKDGFMKVDSWGIYEYSSVFIPVDSNAVNDLSINKNMLEMVHSDRMKNFLSKNVVDKTVDINLQELIKSLQQEINSIKESNKNNLTIDEVDKKISKYITQYNSTLKENLLGIVGDSVASSIIEKLQLNKLEEVIEAKVVGAIRTITGKL